MQDAFGRLFHNNLNNVQYYAKVTNTHVAEAAISSDLEHIEVYGRNRGATLMEVGVVGMPAHDVVVLDVGVLIEPHSPIRVHVGGSIGLTMQGRRTQGWQTSDYDIISVDSFGTVKALRPGTGTVELNGAIAKVKVLEIASAELGESTKTEEACRFDYRLLWENEHRAERIDSFAEEGAQVNNKILVECKCLQD